MGISGLHHQLKPAQKRIDVSELRGRTLALDGHALLHRGALSCAEQLAEGEPTTRYAHFAVQRVQMLAAKGVTPIVVFFFSVHREFTRPLSFSCFAFSRFGVLLFSKKKFNVFFFTFWLIGQKCA